MTRHGRTSAAARGMAAFILLTGCAAQRPAPTAEAAAAGVRQALQRFNDASAAGDLAAVMAQFDDQADVLLVGSDRGEVFKGRAAMEGWLGSLFSRNRFSWHMDRVEISQHGDTAWAFVDGSMTVRGGSGQVRGSTPYRISAVLVRQGEAWRWRLFHGSVPGGH